MGGGVIAMATIHQFPPSVTASDDATSAGGTSHHTHGTEKTACRLYSRIAGLPQEDGNASAGAVASQSPQAAPAQTNSNAPDATAAACTATARPSESGVGHPPVFVPGAHATFNPDAAPAARTDALEAIEREYDQQEFRAELKLDLALAFFAIGIMAIIGASLPFHVEVEMPVSCYSTGC